MQTGFTPSVCRPSVFPPPQPSPPLRTCRERTGCNAVCVLASLFKLKDIDIRCHAFSRQYRVIKLNAPTQMSPASGFRVVCHPRSHGTDLVWHPSRVRRLARRSGTQNGDVRDKRTAYDAPHERVQRVHVASECTRRLNHAPCEAHDSASPSRPRPCPRRSRSPRKRAKLACQRPD